MKSFFSSALGAALPALAAGAGLNVGDSWTEARSYRDPASGLRVMQMTTRGYYNQGPTVHYGSAFSGNGDAVFASVREGRSMLLSGDVKTGRLTVRYLGPEIPDFEHTTLQKMSVAHVPYLDGINCAASPRNRLAAVITRRANTVHLVDLENNTARLLVNGDDDPDRWITTPAFSGDGRSVAFPAGSKTGADKAKTRNPTTYFLADPTGKLTRLYDTDWGQTHLIGNPVHPELWIIKKGRPASSYPMSDKAHRAEVMRRASCFVLNAKTGALMPILPRDGYKDITHLSWNYRGDRIVYHGMAAAGGNYIGAMTRDGKVLWEHRLAEWHPRRNGLNHIAADSVSDAIIDDGLTVPNRISMLDYSGSGADGAPKVKVLAEWRNQWNAAMPGQANHPHPAVSPDGGTVVFFGCRDNTTHVYAIDVTPLRQPRPVANGGN